MVFLFRLLGRLPLSWVHRLGGWLGIAVWLASPTYRRHLAENMRQASIPVALRWAVAASAGRQMLELSALWQHPAPATLVVEADGWACVDEAQAAGKGIVFLTPHLGCFEVTAQYFAARGGDITVLYRPPKRAALQTLIQEGRQRVRLHLAPAELSGVRALIKALKRGQAVGLLPDQAPKQGEGVWLRFFGRWAYTMTLAARLTETGAATIFCWAERLPDGRGYRMKLRPANQPLTGDTLSRAAQINGEIEALIRECPAQYLWGYNRYKRPGGAEPPPME